MEWQKLETACGSPLFFYRMPGRKTSAFAVLAKVGTRDEKWPSEAGFAHAFEHMPFRGTVQFSSSKKLAAHLEDIGGAVNAFTTHEGTVYYTIVPAWAYERGVTVLGELMCNPLLQDEAIVIERLAIIEEIHRRNDDPKRKVLDRVQELLYDGHALARSILGIEEVIQNVTALQLRQFSKKFYNPANLTFLGIGDLDPVEAVDIFNQSFASTHMWNPYVRTVHVVPPISNSRSETAHRDVEQTYCALAAWIPTHTQVYGTALGVFDRMLDAGMSFPVFQEVRERRGLCYEVWTGTEFFTDNGMFRFYAGVNKKRVREALDIFFKVVASSKTDNALLERAKSNALGRFDLNSEDPGSLIDLAVADVIFYGHPRTLDEHKRQIVSVKIEEIEEAVNQHLLPELFAESCIVPRDET